MAIRQQIGGDEAADSACCVFTLLLFTLLSFPSLFPPGRDYGMYDMMLCHPSEIIEY